MDLSNNLISQFAKLTTGDKDKNKETTVYGTVKIYDGKTCVKLDGSDLLTPVDTTTEVKEGQRVAVLVKNHSAVIMGNTSDPSAGLSTTDGITEDVNHFRTLTANNFTATNATIENLKATKADIKDLEAANATIENLKATKAEIKDLEATNATINTLEANKANVVDLNATNATINDLKVSKADIADLNALDAEIDNLSSNFATIQQLNATNANINILDAEVADIQTLVNGNLTSDNISSLNLTSANTTVDNAFIKDAMIDSITASKLTAGIIDTSAISIKSKDGSMLITGSVQQFTDENGKVRIQIGKDSGGKFTFILYDESGTGVLIDESGIKSSKAIADGLIVDSKVAGNANISGNKLDIASVITEVNNNNSTTIKSNKIYLNEQGQSLEVAFNSLKTHVDTIQDESIDGDLSSIKEQVQSNTTQINVNKSGISTLVSQNEIRKEEIKNLDDEIIEVSTDINSKYTSLQQDLSGFKTTVGKTYTTKTDFNNLNNNLTNNYSTTSAMNTAINQKANEITSSVSQTYATKQSVTDVSNNLKNNYSTTSAMNTAINQKANEITSSVSETYTTKSEFNNLSVGGRNLLAVSNETEIYSSTGVSGRYIDTFGMSTTIIPTGTEYIVSFEAKASANMTCRCYFYNPNTTTGCETSTGYKGTKADGECTVKITTSWKRYWVKWTQTVPTSKKYVIVGRNDTAGVTLEIRAIKLEEGNKPTAWSPAPELATNSINALTTRMQTAESKLTKESLTTTIGDYYTTASDISNYGYATTSQVTQTKNDLTATFKSVGGYNLIKNSCGYGGTRGWTTTCDIYTRSNSSYAKSTGIDSILYITSTATSEKYAYSSRFELKPNTTYTLSGYIWKSSNVSGYDVFILTSTDVTGSNTGTTYTNTVKAHSGSAGAATYFENTFTTVSNTMSGYIRIDHNGCNNSGATTSCNVHFTGLCLVEGSVAKPWSPHPSETYSASTIVDAKGIKVTHTNAVGYTQMDANGFYLNDGSKNILSVTSSGANFNMPISANLITTGTLDASKVTVTNLSASSITTGTFSGSRISGGKISATDEISFVGGAKIFGNEGSLDAGLTVSAAGIILGGGSVNYLKGSWFVLNGDLEIEEGDLVLNSGYKIKCYGIESTYIGCTSIDASSNIDCAGIIYGRGNITLDRGSIWTSLDGTVTRDTIRFNNNLLTSDSSSSSVYVINTNGDFSTLRAARLESGGDVTCWNLWAGGKVYANNVALTSDKRLKTDIRYVNIDPQSIGESGLMSPNVHITTKDMLEFIESIPFASYRMKNEVEKDIDYTYYGFIAQDLLETKVGSELIEYSEVIVENKTYDDEGRERIDYTTEERLRYSENKFIAFLAGAVQEDIKQRKAADKELMDMLNSIINE